MLYYFLHRYSQDANHAFLKSEVIANGRKSMDANSETGGVPSRCNTVLVFNYAINVDFPSHKVN